jgi:Bacterial Ig-like domain (group 3)/Regulator of chromosome condensation (RCC1) repeat
VGFVLAVVVASFAVVTAPPASAATAPPGIGLTWGDNSVGQLGNGTTNSSNTPVNVQLPAGTTITKIAAGYHHSLALTSTGAVLAWGNNGLGQLGNGTNTDSSTPVAVQLPAGTTIIAIAAGQHHSLALTSTGAVLAWGDNFSGQLGNGTNTNTNTPVAVSAPATTGITAIAAGANHSLALTSTGAVLAWGNNGLGELGNGTNPSTNTPVAVSAPATSGITAIAAGGAHSLAIRTPITPVTSSTTLSAAPTNPSFGQPVTLTATVTCTGGDLTGGTLSFTDHTTGTTLGTTTVNPVTGVAATTVHGLPGGAHEIRAHVTGVATCAPSTSNTVTVTVGCHTISGTHVGSLNVSTPTCLAPGTQIFGKVTISGAGSLDAENATIRGALTATSGTGLRVCSSTINGPRPTNITGINGVIVIGDAGDDGNPTCGANTLRGRVTLTGNTGSLELGGNQIRSTVTVTNNTTTITTAPENAAEIEANQISGNLACSGNTPLPPTNDGHPNTVTGTRSGQCATL